MRRIGLGAFFAYLLLPEVALFVLVGIATSWWLAGLIAGGSLVSLVVAYAAKRSTGFLGRVFGTVDYDPLDYSQWTRHLVIKPLAVSLPASFAVGGWLWLRWEDKQKGELRSRPWRALLPKAVGTCVRGRFARTPRAQPRKRKIHFWTLRCATA